MSRPILFIFITIVIDAIGLGIIFPVLPDLLVELLGTNTAHAALWGAVLTVSYAFTQFLFGPFIGSLSDKVGRRPVLLISLFALGIDYIIMGVASSIWLLVAGRLLAGIAGATFVTASAYISDVSKPEQRAANFGLVGAAFGVGFVIGPAVGGLLGEFGTRVPFFAAAGMALLNFLYGVFVLPESLKAENRRPMSLAKSNPLAAIIVVRQFPALLFVLASIFLFDVAHYVYPSVWSFWAKEVFGWTVAEIGMSLAAIGVGFALVQGYFIRFILPKLGELNTAFLSYGLTFISLIAFGFVDQGWMVYALIPITAFGAMATPALTGILANSVSDEEQGMIQGVISGFAAIATIISPLIMNPLFYEFSREGGPFRLPGMPYLAAAVLILGATFCLAVGRRQQSIQAVGNAGAEK